MIIMFLLNWNIPRPSLLTIRFPFLIWISLLLKSFLALKVLMPQFGRYCTLLRFSVCVSPVSVAQIIVLLPKPSGVASPLTVLIDGRVAGVYIPVLKSSVDLAIWVSDPVSNNVPFCLISSQFFLFR
jgi:hypothetical protein